MRPNMTETFDAAWWASLDFREAAQKAATESREADMRRGRVEGLPSHPVASYGSIAERAQAGKDAGLWNAAGVKGGGNAG